MQPSSSSSPLPDNKVLQNWLVQGPKVLPLADMTPTQQAVEISLVSWQVEATYRDYLFELGRDLQDVDDATLSTMTKGDSFFYYD